MGLVCEYIRSVMASEFASSIRWQCGRVVKAVDLKSTTFACVGSNPTAVAF